MGVTDAVPLLSTGLIITYPAYGLPSHINSALLTAYEYVPSVPAIVSGYFRAQLGHHSDKPARPNPPGTMPAVPMCIDAVLAVFGATVQMRQCHQCHPAGRSGMHNVAASRDIRERRPSAGYGPQSASDVTAKSRGGGGSILGDLHTRRNRRLSLK